MKNKNNKNIWKEDKGSSPKKWKYLTFAVGGWFFCQQNNFRIWGFPPPPLSGKLLQSSIRQPTKRSTLGQKIGHNLKDS